MVFYRVVSCLRSELRRDGEYQEGGGGARDRHCTMLRVVSVKRGGFVWTIDSLLIAPDTVEL